MTIEEALGNIKNNLKNNQVKITDTRGGKTIDNLHEAIKFQIKNILLEKEKIIPNILPTIGEHKKGELKLSGFYKTKTQDICLTPNTEQLEEVLNFTALNKEVDKFGFDFTQKTLSINVRSQISKITANTDTMFERTFAEALNLHLRCPNMVLGDIYLLSLYDFGKTERKNKATGKKEKVIIGYLSKKTVEKYIKFFQAINNRNCKNCRSLSGIISPETYEATALLIVDFSQSIPKFYNSTKELIDDDFLPQNTTVRYEGLEWDSFFNKILGIYNQRFGLQYLQH